jgi:hypothetical protein
MDLRKQAAVIEVYSAALLFDLPDVLVLLLDASMTAAEHFVQLLDVTFQFMNLVDHSTSSEFRLSSS